MTNITPTIPQYDFITSNKPINLFMSGQGSGKTAAGGMISANLISQFPNVRGLVCANTFDQLNRATMLRIREIWKLLGIEEYNEQTGKGCYVAGIQPPSHFNTDNHNFDRYNNIYSFDNGAVIYVASLDNYKAIEGIEVGWAILDETKDTKEEAVKEVILGRLRQSGIYIKNKNLTTEKTKFDINPLYIITSPAKVQWLNEWFELEKHEIEIKNKIFSKIEYFSKEIGNKKVVISSTYHNNNLPENYIKNMIQSLPSNLIDMLIYGCPFSKSGGEFWTAFDRDKHVKELTVNDKLPLHISLDQNVNPYYTMTVWQIEKENENYKIKCIDEICLKNPKATTEAVCNELIYRYENILKNGIYYYGDASGRKKDTRSVNNDYDILRKVLAKYISNASNRVPSINPSVISSKNLINRILEGKFYNLFIEINKICVNLINDLLYLREGADGMPLKEKAKDINTGVTYEKYGHTSDTMRYFINKNFEKWTKY